jgi:hypothetical protein
LQTDGLNSNKITSIQNLKTIPDNPNCNHNSQTKANQKPKAHISKQTTLAQVINRKTEEAAGRVATPTQGQPLPTIASKHQRTKTQD